MQKEDLNSQIKFVAEKFLEKSKDKEIYLVSHFDTDGITSATLMLQTLKKLDKTFTLKIVKSLEEQFIRDLPKDKLILFTDLASGSLNYLKETGIEHIFIIDHHEITQEIPENVTILNPHLNGKEKISGAGLTYLFCKELEPTTKELAKLAVLGMIGDRMEKDIEALNHGILNDGEIVKKRGLLIYPSTRPLNRTLEYSSNPYIPEVTGNIKGVLELLRECSITPKTGKYPCITQLTEEEMSKIVTGIMLRNPKCKNHEIVGDIFLIKLFNKLEDARELSAMINACSRLGESNVAIRVCMEISEAKKEATSIHTKYRQHIISGLKYANETEEKIQGKRFVILNARHEIKDTMIGTIASILSSSPIYEEGTIIVAMAYYEDKIKVSTRSVGESGRNLREIMADAVETIGNGEAGGHEFAAGAIIHQSKETDFINHLRKSLEIETIKIQPQGEPAQETSEE